MFCKHVSHPRPGRVLHYYRHSVTAPIWPPLATYPSSHCVPHGVDVVGGYLATVCSVHVPHGPSHLHGVPQGVNVVNDKWGWQDVNHGMRRMTIGEDC